ncbi:MAG: hypothetical protein ACI4PS_02255 [Rhodocyclaceae bacterium]
MENLSYKEIFDSYFDNEKYQHFFANYANLETIKLPKNIIEQMQDLITAVEKVITISNEKNNNSSNSSNIRNDNLKGIFMGYDFHLQNNNENKNITPKLIEINTNAGGAFLNLCLLNAIYKNDKNNVADKLANEFVAMFKNEFTIFSNNQKNLQTIAIVDENPSEQFLYPEFEICQKILVKNNIQTIISSPENLSIQNNNLYYNNSIKIDFVYNRLTDFYLRSNAKNNALLTAYQNDFAAISPNPKIYDLYANKNNLINLSNADFLDNLNIDNQSKNILLKHIPKILKVKNNDNEYLWKQRKNLFFKTAEGYGSKAVYRGDKLTKKVFAEIIESDAYLAQEIIPPSEHLLKNINAVMKADFRCYCYNGKIQLVAARLYQGQTTNFRTENGGFMICESI